MRWFLCTCWLLIWNWGIAQTNQIKIAESNPVIDSLKQALRSESENEEIFELQYSLFRKYIPINTDSSLKYASLANSTSLVIGDSLLIVRAMNAIGGIMRSEGDYERAIRIYTIATGVARRGNYIGQLKYLLSNLAISYSELSQFEEALKYNLESLEIRRQEQNPLEIATTLNNIGVIFQDLGDLDQALHYYSESYKMKIESGIAYDLPLTTVNISDVLSELGRNDEADTKLREVDKLCDSLECEMATKAQIYLVKAINSMSKEEFSTAESYAKKSMMILANEPGSMYTIKRDLCIAYYRLAQIKFKQGYPADARSFLDLSSAIANKSGFRKARTNNLKLYSEIYFADGKFRKAMEMYLQFQKEYEEILNAKNLGRLSRIQSEFDERERLLQLKAQEKIMALQSETIRQHRDLNLLIGLVALLVLVLAVILFIAFNRKRRDNRLLDFKVRERTHELELSRDEFRHAYEEKVYVLNKVSENLRASIQSMNGLSYVGEGSLTGEQQFYFREMAANLEKAIEDVRQYIPRKD